MPTTLIATLSERYQISHQVYSVVTGGFTSKVPTTTQPSGDGVIPCGTGGEYAQNGFFIMPVATGTTGHTFSMRILGWSEISGPSIAVGTLTLWVPTLLVEVVATISSSVTGVANGALGTSILFCDTMTLTTGNANVSNEIVSPGSNVLANLTLDIKGAKLVEIVFNMTSGDAGAALYRKL